MLKILEPIVGYLGDCQEAVRPHGHEAEASVGASAELPSVLT